MLYRIFRGINEVYPAVWLGIFMLLAIVAFAFTVIYPIVPIVLVISSVFLVVGVRCGYLALKWIEHKLAREALAGGNCPACRADCDALRIGSRRVLECQGCRRAFEENGEKYVPRPEDAEQSADFERTAEAI
ncbi:MAG: hypothetical protein RLZZ116_2896 [Planctomycetota bacterium]|jgi:hypothetical protein